MDSKIELMRQAVKRDRSVTGVWTNYLPSLERTVLKKDRFLSDEPEPSPELAPPPVSPAAVASAPRASSSASPFADKLKQALR
jgi:hypothetical protein